MWREKKQELDESCFIQSKITNQIVKTEFTPIEEEAEHNSSLLTESLDNDKEEILGSFGFDSVDESNGKEKVFGERKIMDFEEEEVNIDFKQEGSSLKGKSFKSDGEWVDSTSDNENREEEGLNGIISHSSLNANKKLEKINKISVKEKISSLKDNLKNKRKALFIDGESIQHKSSNSKEKERFAIEACKTTRSYFDKFKRIPILYEKRRREKNNEYRFFSVKKKSVFTSYKNKAKHFKSEQKIDLNFYKLKSKGDNKFKKITGKG